MKTTTPYIILLATLSACDYEPPCIEGPGVVCPPPTEPCFAADSGDTGGAQCTPFEKPHIDGSFVECNGNVSDIEVMSDDAAVQYGVTDYAFESGSTSFAGILDFQPLPDGGIWAGYMRAALPGVATHDGLGQTWSGYFSRVCCPQAVVSGTLSGFPASPTCSSGYALNPSPNAWCLDMEGLAGAGMCVFPCTTDADCPEPSREFCDLSVPDPNGNGPGTCRYKSMPTVPTAHEDIDP